MVTEDAPPLQTIQQGEVQGVVTKKVRSVLNKAGLNAQIKAYPWARSYHLATHRNNTLIYPLARTPEREGKFIWLGKVAVLELVFVRLADNHKMKMKTMTDARHFIIGASRDDMTHEVLLEHGFDNQQHLLVESNISRLLDLLYARKIDSFVADLAYLKILAVSKGKDASQLVSAYPFPVRPDYYLAASLSSDPEIVKALKAAF